MRVVLLAVVGIDVHAADHAAGRGIENGVGEASPVLEVVGVPLQVAQVVRHAAVVGPGAGLPAGCHAYVLHGRRPRLIVGVVVLRPEWFEPELLRRQSERDDESGRDERPLHHIRILADPAARWRRCRGTVTALHITAGYGGNWSDRSRGVRYAYFDPRPFLDAQ